jgi:low temperature requirement protein LtrA
VSAEYRERQARLTTTRRVSERVTPLELFFDLVFVLALTQCTSLMASEPTWEGLAKGLLVLGVLWWSWVGYAWLTSVVDPEEGAVRLVMFGATAALLVAALCVPDVFGDDALVFACAYGVVRFSQIALFVLASRDDPALRRSVLGLAGGTGLGVGLLLVASATDGWLQGAIWVLALVLDLGEPYLFGAEGWSLEHPSHFAERHGLIIIIALGESIVAIGVGAGHVVDAGVVAAAILGVAVAAAFWWLYFDVVAYLAERNLSELPPGRERNERARDVYSYIHFPMVAGIVVVALGMKKTLSDVGGELDVMIASALLGGAALYLLALVAHRYRNVHSVNNHRLVAGVLLVALIPVATQVPALAIVAALGGVLWGLIVLEGRRYAGSRQRVRQELASETGE